MIDALLRDLEAIALLVVGVVLVLVTLRLVGLLVAWWRRRRAPLPLPSGVRVVQVVCRVDAHGDGLWRLEAPVDAYKLALACFHPCPLTLQSIRLEGRLELIVSPAPLVGLLPMKWDACLRKGAQLEVRLVNPYDVVHVAVLCFEFVEVPGGSR